MAAVEEDRKPFLSPITHGQGLYERASAPPPPRPRLERGARFVADEQQVPCVLNRPAPELPKGGGYQSRRDQTRAEADAASTSRASELPRGGGYQSRGDETRVDAASTSRSSCSAPRISRKFWNAGDYDAAGGSSAPPPPQPPPTNGQNRLCVHPKFLHSNATSHKWPFGAVAELLDNAVDEIKSGATRIVVDKIVDVRSGSPALLVQDDGGGMDPASLRRCLSFGFSDKQSGSSIGQYGNGFKTSTMRLGADVIVFTRCMKSREPTQSIGLLSYTFLTETDQKDVIVPMVNYKYNLFTGETELYQLHAPDQFSSNLSVLLKWSPFATEEELMQNFNDVGPHGTKIVVFNLWSNDDGDLELDFGTKEDIMISGAPKPVGTNDTVKRMNQNHLANQLRYSLRVYSSVLYLQLPGYFKIILRGQEVKRHSIATDLRYPQCICYKPQLFEKEVSEKETEVFTSIGFLHGAPTISVHGFNIYHKNRLILPFHQVLSSASSKGRSVAGVLQADFIKPTHDKQDFEKSRLYQKLMTRLKEMTNEYWDLHCHLIGYHKAPRPAASAHPPALPIPRAVTTVAEPSKWNAIAPIRLAVPSGPTNSRDNPLPSGPNSRDNPSYATPISFAPLLRAVPAGTSTGATRAPAPRSGMRIVRVGQGSSPSVAPPSADSAEARKRKNETFAETDSRKRQITDNVAGENPAEGSSHQVCQYTEERDLKELSFLELENKMLQDECLNFEIAEKELLLKEKKLRLSIEHANAQYKSLLNEYISVSAVKTEKQ